MAIITSSQILTWKTDGKLFALEIDHCKEVARDTKITQVPFASEDTVGIVNLRGEVITIVDLRALLGEKKPNKIISPTIIRMKSKSSDRGLIVEEVLDVVLVDQDKIQPAPSNYSEFEQRYIRAVMLTPDGLVSIVNHDEVLS